MPGVVDVALTVDAMRFLTHSGIEHESNPTRIAVQARQKAAEAARHVGNLNERGRPQRLIRRGVIDKVEKLGRWFGYAGQSMTPRVLKGLR
jgi:hypothetical protein